MILPGRDTFPTTANTTHTQCVLLVWRVQGHTQTTDSGDTAVNTPRAIIIELAGNDGNGMTDLSLSRLTGKPLHKIATWLDQLTLDGYIERYQRPVYITQPTGPQIELYRLVNGFERPALVDVLA